MPVQAFKRVFGIDAEPVRTVTELMRCVRAGRAAAIISPAAALVVWIDEAAQYQGRYMRRGKAISSTTVDTPPRLRDWLRTIPIRDPIAGRNDSASE